MSTLTPLSLVTSVARRTAHRPQLLRRRSPKQCNAVASHRFSSNHVPPVTIPDPTWSIRDLQLTTSNTPPVSMAELQRLATKSLLDIDKLSDPHVLQQDLANMLHCLEQIQTVDLPLLSDQQIYDVPRGVHAAPMRSESDGLKHTEELEAKEVWESLLKFKTEARGGHYYFSAITKRETLPDS